MQQVTTNNSNPYAKLWNDRVLQNGWFFLPLVGVYKALAYIVSARFIVTFTKWLLAIAYNIVEGVLTLLLAAGKCAESLFIICTFYVLCYMVARPFLVAGLGQNTITNANHIVLIVFTALPELILLEAIKTSVERVYRVTQLWAEVKSRITSIVWAGLTILPTGFFVVLTIYTLTSFAGSTEHNFDMTQLVGFALLFRILPGWCYAIVNGLYEKFGKDQFHKYIDQLKQAIASRDAMISERDHAVQTLMEANDSLHSEIDLLKSQLRDVQQELLLSRARKQVRKNVVVPPETGQTSAAIECEKKDSSDASTQVSTPVTGLELDQTSAGEYSVSEVVAAEMLGIPARSVSRLVRNTRLKRAPNSQKITVSSIEKYALKKSIDLKRGAQNKENDSAVEPVKQEPNTEEIPVANVQNGHTDKVVQLGEYAEMLV